MAPKPVLYPEPAPSAIRKLESEGVAVDEVISAEENARDPGYQLAKRGGHGRAMAEHAAPYDSGRRTCFNFAVGELGIYISTGLGVALSTTAKPN